MSEPETARPQGPTWDLPIPNPRVMSWRFLFVFFAVALAINTGFAFLVFRDAEFWFWPAWRLQQWTRGLWSLTLSANLLNLLLLVVAGLMLIGQLQARELGLDWRQLPRAGLALLAMLVGLLILQFVLGFFTGHDLGWHPSWIDSWPTALGRWIDQLLGNTLVEEIVYRAFLPAQIYHGIGRRFADKPHRRLAITVVLSQTMFALVHLPADLRYGFPVGMIVGLFAQFLAGLLLAGVYYFSRNLFFTMAVHTLVNSPPPLWTEDIKGGIVTGIATLVTVIATLIWTSWRPKA